jgi:valyl-tRNA synthetase
MLDKTYQPAEVEERIYRAWEAAHAFDAGRAERRDAAAFSIVIPPPNVTGSLHMGHALNNTLQDILARFERMRGKDVLWQPGTDHAGIATQMVVERKLAETNEDRRTLGREEFVNRVWKWKEESGGTITRQLKKLGASCDWRRERFTMDEGLSRAVVKVFVELYRQGLIYKDKRLVNWDPKLLTAISDLEVQQVETKGHLWHLRYPLEGKKFSPDDPSTFIVVATTRPETMLGDTAVAVHPDDERYKHLVGKHVILPLVGRRIPIVADEYSDPEKGSGAVKITPAHDFNDFEVGRRHNLRPINVMGEMAQISLFRNFDFWEGSQFVRDFEDVDDLMNSLWGIDPETDEIITYKVENESLRVLRDFDGLDRFAARKRVVAMMEERGLIEKIEPNVHMVPHGDRSGAVLEPFLTDQWYVNAKKLAEPAIEAVRAGRTNFIPKNWEKTYFEWMENIQPWNISRQLWWGHQIPAWYGLNDDIFCAQTEAEAIAAATAKYGKPVKVTSKGDAQTKILLESTFPDKNGRSEFKGTTVPIYRDEDVLDTWFSSALWPFSTLGWPDKTPELKRYYPTTVLVTGFDIIFFWVARMMMMGLHFMQKERPAAPSSEWVPFRHVYIHALVRDERGAKMSKSKGNVIDPLHLIDDYGADALRFTLAAMAAQGRDIKLSTARVEGYRNFATKLWNAARFAEMNGAARAAGFDPKTVKETLNRWIVGETERAIREVTAAIEAYKFNEAAAAAYRFVWSVYCDWYIELAKPALTGPDGVAKTETRATAAFVQDEILKLLHPFMPFITEELWGLTADAVIPGRREAPGPESTATAGSMDSGLAPSARPGMTGRSSLLVLAEWPTLEGLEDKNAEAEIGWLVDLVSAVRSVRSEMNVPAATQVPLVLVASAETRARAGRWEDALKRLARLSAITFADRAPKGAVQLVVRGEVAALPLAGVIDLAAERARLQKEMQRLVGEVERIDKKLGNADFVARAPEEVVDGEREKRAEFESERGKVAGALARLEEVA